MSSISVNSLDTQQTLSIDSRGLDDLKRGARAERGSPEFIAAIDKVAVQFESIFLQMALKSMRDATPEGGLFTDSTTKTFQSMYDQELVQMLSGKGLGLAGEVARQLKTGAGVGSEQTIFPSGQIKKDLLLTFPQTDR